MQNLLLIRKLFGLTSVKSGVIYDLLYEANNAEKLKV